MRCWEKLCWALQIGALWGLLFSPPVGGAEEPGGFLDRPWGSRWDDDVVRSLPGCGTQGEVLADVEGYIAIVAQPECVGYRFSDRLTVNLILIYPDIKWHSLEKSRLVVANLLAFRHMWGLAQVTAARLERWSAELDRRSMLRMQYGSEEPIFPDMAYAYHIFDRPESARGLQGYQVNFPRAQYVMIKAALMRQFGPPARESYEAGQFASGGEILEWLGDKTIVVMKERGSAAASGYFSVITRGYLELIETSLTHNVIIRRSTPFSYPWFLQLVEGFDWARNHDDHSTGSDMGARLRRGLGQP